VAGYGDLLLLFLNFTFSALLTPVFGSLLLRVGGGVPQLQLEHYQTTFAPLLIGVAIAVLLTFFLKETGPASQLRQANARGNDGNYWDGQVRRAAGEVPQP